MKPPRSRGQAIRLAAVARRVALVSLNVEGKDPSEVAYELDERFGILTRSGLHCAPLAHRVLGTYPIGTVRFSFGFYNTEKEILKAVKALKSISKNNILSRNGLPIFVESLGKLSIMNCQQGLV